MNFNLGAIGLLAGIGVGVGLAAALLTYRSFRAAPASDPERADALERFKQWIEFWKYFLVSFALVLITTLLGNILKERELALQKAKQEADATLENQKQASAALIAESTNLGSFLDRALADSWEKQVAFASYFSHLTRDPEARQRWNDYVTFISQQRQKASDLETKKAETEVAIAKVDDPNSQRRVELEKEREKVQSQLDVTKAILQSPSTLSIRGVKILDGGTLYKAGLSIDVSGAPHAYHPDNKSGLDFLVNAGKPGNWWALLTDNGTPSGNPVVQGENDPAPGFYIATTSLQDQSKDPKDPRRYVDSEKVPFVDVPLRLRTVAEIRAGDFAAVLNTKNGKLCYAVVAGFSPQIGEGSIALANALGVNADAKHTGATDGFIYKIFPGSGKGWPQTIQEINSQGEALLQKWGGQARVQSEFAGPTAK